MPLFRCHGYVSLNLSVEPITQCWPIEEWKCFQRTPLFRRQGYVSLNLSVEPSTQCWDSGDGVCRTRDRIRLVSLEHMGELIV